MADKDFNRSMSRYLSARKRWRPQYLSSLRFSRRAKPRVMMEGGELVVEREPTTYDKMRSWASETFSRKKSADEDIVMDPYQEAEAVTAPTESYEEEVHVEMVSDMPEPVKPSLWSRLTASFSRKSEVVEKVEPAQIFLDELKTDMKYVASNFIGIMEQLSHRQREKVKASEEFDSIKEVFKKHNIIK